MKEDNMANEQKPTQEQGQQGQNQQGAQPGEPLSKQQISEQLSQQLSQQEARQQQNANFDGLADKKAEDLTPEELRLMADTMPGEGPGD
jgi:hypothetical protein